MPRFLEHSKRQAWLLTEYRTFLKENHPDLYRRIRAAARRQTLKNSEKWNLINITLRNVMYLHFTDRWLELIRECDEIFGCQSRPNSPLGQIAWAIATAIQVDKEDV